MSVVGLLTLIVAYISTKLIGAYLVLPKSLFEIVRISIISIEILVLYVLLSCIFKVNYINEMLNRILSKLKRA